MAHAVKTGRTRPFTRALSQGVYGLFFEIGIGGRCENSYPGSWREDAERGRAGSGTSGADSSVRGLPLSKV